MSAMNRFAALMLAVSYLGGEAAQITLGLPQAMTGVLQGLMLFFLLAADVLVYFGDLASLFAQIARVLDAGGLYAFSIELSAEQDFLLQPSGRYAHATDYVRRVCNQFGFEAGASNGRRSGLIAQPGAFRWID